MNKQITYACKTLLLPERMILESLSKSPKTEKELSDDTSMTSLQIRPFILALAKRKWIFKKAQWWFLRSDYLGRWYETAEAKWSMQREVEDLLSASVDSFYQGEISVFERSEFRLKKLWMTSAEEAYFLTLLNRMESVIKDIEKKQKNRIAVEKLCRQKIFFWGHGPYSKILQATLKRV